MRALVFKDQKTDALDEDGFALPER